MAVRFDADTEEYTRAVSLGTVTQFTITCWAKISVDRNNSSSLWCVDNGFSGDYFMVSTDVDGTTLHLRDDTSIFTIGALTIGTWYHVGVAVNGANATIALRAAGDATSTISTVSTASPSTDAVNLRIGDGIFNGLFWNGCVAAFKLWNGVTLSSQELDAESRAYLPQRTGTRAWYPFLQAETVDYSGNAQTLSGGTGTSTEDGPPVTWGPRRKAFYAPAPTSTPISFADSGAAADDMSVAADVPLGDASTASDSITIAAAAPLSDDAVATDDVSVSVTVALAEDATASDTILVGNPISLADAATADDSWSVVPTPVLDEQAIADDQITASVTVALSDSATATDQFDVTELISVSLADSATASDAINVITPSDVTVVARLERGWDAGAAVDVWDGAEPERGWEPATPDRAWAADDPGRGWDADPPTL